MAIPSIFAAKILEIIDAIQILGVEKLFCKNQALKSLVINVLPNKNL